MDKLILVLKYLAAVHALFIVLMFVSFIVQLCTNRMSFIKKLNGVLRFLVLSVPCWVLYLVSTVPVYLLGWVMVPLAAACKAYVMTDKNPGKPADGAIYHFTWKVMHIWDNYGDGIANKNYWVAPNLFLQIVYWSCFRNPLNNMRITPVFSLMIRASKVRFIGSFGDSSYYRPIVKRRQPVGKLLWYDQKIPHWFFAWQGLYSNFYWQFVIPFTFKIPFTELGYNKGDLLRAWIGHKIYPDDIMGKPLGYREFGAGFGMQFKRIKKAI